MAALASMAALSASTASNYNVIPSSSSCTSGSAAVNHSSSSTSSQLIWCKESLKAMETHLSLLKENKNTNTIDSLSSPPSFNTKLHQAAAPGPLDHVVQVDFMSPLRGSALLPRGWEQHLDLRTGRMYYINWETCKRSYEDPRAALRRADMMINGLIWQAMCNSIMQAGGDRNSLSNEGDQELLHSSVTQELHGQIPAYGFINSNHLTLSCSSKDDDEDMEAVESKWNPSVNLDGASDDSNYELYGDSLNDVFGSNGKYGILSDGINVNLSGGTNVPLSVMQSESQKQQITAPNQDLKPKVESMRCHNCLSQITIHIANPWCPQCGLALV